ncbi:alkylation response protein AidB-like acyl-CoA dehydrogenase [Sphingobium fontiphilum]|uniref:Alkylation response protein AidB-like acyl-CoA dehydrogenase n=1 Tax=Sphingobium fontiphilum TaxID=944425 RepID=A0A7W6DFH1_9SPHN|nr:acyl-CoA dehydrogenase family protein [Sphingobium fontiphilum]MBB3982330.1 alkylation response protein AidB-like acyl-CoA dehydrogenase [Sphingobium fontiphilum]
MDFELPEEYRSFRDMVRRWVDNEAPKDWARALEKDEHNYPFALWDKFTEAGFHGVGIAEEYDGQGGDVVMQMLLARELARSLGGLAWIWGITSFAGSKSIGLYGSAEQKAKYLPLIATGQLKAAIAFTEPGGGTDLLGAMATTAERVDGGWKINGEKIWSSSAHVADYLLVIARSDRTVEKKHQGLTLFWVPTKTAGVKITPLAKLGMRSMGSCSVHFEDAFVPDDLVLGEPHKAWYMLLPTLNNERIMVGAFCLGVIDGVLEDALDYMKQRKAFGGIIGRFQSLQHYVADIATMQKTTELMLHFCADKQSRGENVGIEANMLKLMASENANAAADMGIQILGGMGYSAETDMQRYWRDSRLWRIGPITNEMVRNGIAESLDLPRSF